VRRGRVGAKGKKDSDKIREREKSTSEKARHVTKGNDAQARDSKNGGSGAETVRGDIEVRANRG